MVNDNLKALEGIFDAMDDIVILKDENLKFIYGNKALLKLYNTTLDELVGKEDFYFNNNKKQLEIFKNSIKEIYKTGKQKIVYESSTDALSGQIKHYQSLKKLVTLDNKQYVLIVARDITNLFEDKILFEEALETINEGIWEWDILNNQVKHNTTWYKILGLDYTSSSHSIDFFTNIIHSDDKHLVSYRLAESLTNNTIYTSEHRLITSNGDTIWVKDRGKITKFDEYGNPIKMVGSITDITELKKQNDLLILEKNRLNNIINGTNVGTWEWNIQSGEVIFNNMWAEMIGYTLEEIAPISIETWLKYVHPDDLLKSNEILEKYFAKEIDYYECEVRMQHKNGTWIWIQDKGKLIEWDGSKPKIMMGTHIDITSKKEYEKVLEQKVNEKTKQLDELNHNLEHKIIEEIEKNSQKEALLQQQSKMASMGEMISNIAHQWRQPLQGIGLVVQKLNIIYSINGKVELSDIDETIKIVSDQLNYLSKTIDDFSNFFRPDKEKSFMYLSKIIDKSLSLTDIIINKAKITIELNIQDVEIYSYPNSIIQVIINLIKNSVDAFEERQIQSKILIIDNEIKDNNLILRFTDNAGGIDEEIIKKIFEPYFTTKHQSRGTGIGLYMSHELIDRHLKGSIYVKNIHNRIDNSRKGACFTITLPIIS